MPHKLELRLSTRGQRTRRSGGNLSEQLDQSGLASLPACGITAALREKRRPETSPHLSLCPFQPVCRRSPQLHQMVAPAAEPGSGSEAPPDQPYHEAAASAAAAVAPSVGALAAVSRPARFASARGRSFLAGRSPAVATPGRPSHPEGRTSLRKLHLPVPLVRPVQRTQEVAKGVNFRDLHTVSPLIQPGRVYRSSQASRRGGAVPRRAPGSGEPWAVNCSLKGVCRACQGSGSGRVCLPLAARHDYARPWHGRPAPQPPPQLSSSSSGCGPPSLLSTIIALLRQFVSAHELRGLGVRAVLDLRQPPVGCRTERRNLRTSVRRARV